MVECTPCIREFGIQLEVATDLSRKTGSDSYTAKRSQQVKVSRVLGDSHYKRMPLVTGAAR